MNADQIISLPIDQIIPYDNNPRDNTEAVQYVKASIEQFGFRQPIIVDADNVIICGHTRLLAAQELGLDEVPCIRVTDLSEDEVKAYRLADNKVAEMSTWDWGKLEKELGSIDMSLLQFDMSDFGFDSGFVNDAKEANAADEETMSHQNEFKEYGEDIETQHKCPMCGYEW